MRSASWHWRQGPQNQARAAAPPAGPSSYHRRPPWQAAMTGPRAAGPPRLAAGCTVGPVTHDPSPMVIGSVMSDGGPARPHPTAAPGPGGPRLGPGHCGPGLICHRDGLVTRPGPGFQPASESVSRVASRESLWSRSRDNQVLLVVTCIRMSQLVFPATNSLRLEY